jgi:hypothetical protein
MNMPKLCKTLLLCLGLQGVLSTQLVAQIEMSTPAVAAAIESKLIPDVRVVVDISGSMKQNDPDNLRLPAVELLVHLFPENAKAGIWTFGQWVNMLANHQQVDDSWREMALVKAQSINSVALRTNIPEAIAKAVDDVDNLDPRYKTHVILLTDGMVDIGDSAAQNTAARNRLLDQLLPDLSAAEVTVHTVALSNNADTELMKRLAVETNGLFAVAETAEDLTRIFLQAFDAAAPAEEVPLENNKFLVDASIDEFTALLFRQQDAEQVVLVSPDGKQHSLDNPAGDIKWFRQGNYDLVTVQNPPAGEWSLIADLEPDSRVTIVSNLSLQVNTLPKSMFIGNEINATAVLKEQGNTITKAEFLRLVDVSVSVSRREDLLQWDLPLSKEEPVPAKGIFTSPLTMLSEAGVYDITVYANSKTFERQYRQTLAVREPFEVKVQSTTDDIPLHEVTLFAQNPLVDTAATAVTVNVEKPDGSSITKAAMVTAERTWVVNLEPVNQSGTYQLTVEAEGRYRNGNRLEYRSATSTITHKVVGYVEPPKPEPVVEPLVEEPAMAAPVPEPAPVVEIEAESTETDWKQMGLYVGLLFGNLLVIGLGYVAYKTIKSGRTSSPVLDDEINLDDDLDDKESEIEDLAEESGAPKAAADTKDSSIEIDDVEIEDAGLDLDNLDVEDNDDEDTSETKKIPDDSFGIDEIDDILDLPDDAIDIDPTSDK